MRVGIFERTSADKYKASEKLFVDTLRELGWVEGTNIVFDRVFANDELSRLPALAAALVNRSPNLIYAIGSADAAVAATRTIPIVLGSQSDFVERGWAKSLAHPGGNLTGTTSFQAEFAAKRIELLKEVAPRIKRIAFLASSTMPASFASVQKKAVDAAANSLKVELREFVVREPAEIPEAFNAMTKSRVEAVLINEEPMLNSNASVIAGLAAVKKLPAVGFASFADAGGLLAYGANRPAVYGRVAYFVDRILKGAKPGDIPFERPTKFDRVINLKTAKTLGIKIPNSILVQATRVIE